MQKYPAALCAAGYIIGTECYNSHILSGTGSGDLCPLCGQLIFWDDDDGDHSSSDSSGSDDEPEETESGEAGLQDDAAAEGSESEDEDEQGHGQDDVCSDGR